MDLRVIYKAQPSAAVYIVELLEEEGFKPVILDDLSSPFSSRDIHLVRIAVPPTEAPGASYVVARWDKNSQLSVKSTSRKLSAHFFHSTLITLLIGVIIALVLGYDPALFILLCFIWLPVFIVVANLRRIFKKKPTNQPPKPSVRSAAATSDEYPRSSDT